MNSFSIQPLVIFGFIVFVVLYLKSGKKKRRLHKESYLKNSLSLIVEAHFSTKTLMNKSEYKLFQKIHFLLESQFKSANFRVFPQVSMGEFLGCQNDSHFSLINSKRVDLLIIDRKGTPVIAIEYQGKGHYQQNAVERDAIKREACRQAGVHYLDIPADYDQMYLDIIRNHLNQYVEKQNERTHQLAKNQ